MSIDKDFAAADAYRERTGEPESTAAPPQSKVCLNDCPYLARGQRYVVAGEVCAGCIRDSAMEILEMLSRTYPQIEPACEIVAKLDETDFETALVADEKLDRQHKDQQ